jgi:hypothetical protein
VDPRDELRDAVMSHVESGGKLPTSSPSRPPDIETGRVGTWQSYVILSCQLYTCWMHWMGDRSLPCLKKRGNCPVDLHTRPIIWRGYCSALAYGSSVEPREAVIGFTQPGLLACPRLYALHDEVNMRGYSIRLTRNGGRQKSQRVEMVGDPQAGLVLPPERNLEEFLWTLWRNDPRLRDWALQAAQPQTPKRASDDDAF